MGVDFETLERAMNEAETYLSKLPGGGSLEVLTAPGVFRPTYTSELCIQAVQKSVTRAGETLDLGCGCGVVGIAAAKMGFAKIPFYASDLSETAVALTRKNADLHAIAVEARMGSIFEPWKGMKFDLIIDDISAISEDVAKLSPWYADNIPCVSGSDGIALTFEVLDQASGYLKDGGQLLFPILSLSSTTKALERAKRNFSRVEKVNSQTWKLPDEMLRHLEALKRMRDEGKINFEMKFGMILCWTEIYRCSGD